MNFANALDATLKHFCLNARNLSVESGVAESSISRYRRGERDIHTESLERLVSALPLEARNYFYFNCLVTEIDEAGIATLLQAIAFQLKRESAKESVKTLISGESLALTPG